MPTDTERMDFLETLLNRTVFVNKKNPAYYMSNDIHVNGPDRCSIYVRNLIGEPSFQSHGNSVREAIDDVFYAMGHK